MNISFFFVLMITGDSVAQPASIIGGTNIHVLALFTGLNNNISQNKLIMKTRYMNISLSNAVSTLATPT